MNKIQESKNSSYKTLDGLFTLNQATIMALPAGVKLVDEFRINLAEIDSLVAKQGVDKSGLADSKEQKREAAIVAGLDVAKRIVAFATIDENPTLLKEAKLGETELRKMADTKLAPKLTALVALGTAHAAKLVDYGVTEEVLARLSNFIAAYAAAMPKPKLGIDETKQITTKLDGIFKKNDVILRKIDALAELEKTGNPEFYKSYKNLRKVVVTGKGSLAMKGLVKDATTGEGIPNVDVLISLAEGGKVIGGTDIARIVKRTATKGSFNIKTLPSGTYSLGISKLGYLTQTLTVDVVDGELCNVVVVLVGN